MFYVSFKSFSHNTIMGDNKKICAKKCHTMNTLNSASTWIQTRALQAAVGSANPSNTGSLLHNRDLKICTNM